MLALSSCCLIALQRAVLVVLALVWSGGHLTVFKWDADWYRQVAQQGYVLDPHWEADHGGPSLAFFPLLPLSARLWRLLPGLGADAALEIAAVAWLPVAAWGIAEVGRSLADRRTALFLVALWGAAPRSLVSILPYTEVIYTALAAWFVVAVLRGRWWWAAVLCAVAGLTRSSATVMVMCLGLAWLRARWRQLLRPRVLLEGLGLACLSASGLVGFFAYVAWRTGEWDGYLHVQEAWHMRMGAPWGTITQMPTIWRVPGTDWLYQKYSVVVVLVALALAVGTLLMRPPWAVADYTIVSTIWVWMAQNYFWCKPRFLLPVFTLALPLARLLSRMPLRLGVVLAVIIGLFGCVVEADLWLSSPAP